MKFKTLFFCTTPLQSLIINKLIQNCKEFAYVIYIPNNNGDLHQIYFDNIETENKTFLKSNKYIFSDTLDHLYNFFKLPLNIRECKFQEIYFASIGDTLLGLLLGRNLNSKLHLFDDGIFNLNKTSFLEWISEESFSKKVVRYLFNGETGLETYKKLHCHHTIYPTHYTDWMSCPVRSINLFEYNNKNISDTWPENQSVKILLGSYFADYQAKEEHAYHKVIKKFSADVYIPHPGNKHEKHFIRDDIKKLFHDNQYKKMIAEEIIINIVKSGYQVNLYGFSSSVLFNLSNLVSTSCFALNSQTFSQKEFYAEAGIKLIKGFK